MKRSIHIGRTLEKLIDDVSDNSDNVTTIINDIADKYTVIVEQCKPDLTQDEWRSLCAAYNGRMVREGAEGMRDEIRAMGWQVSEWLVYNPEEVAQYDCSDLLEKIEHMSIAERIAALHVVKMFWNGRRGSTIPLAPTPKA